MQHRHESLHCHIEIFDAKYYVFNKSQKPGFIIHYLHQAVQARQDSAQLRFPVVNYVLTKLGWSRLTGRKDLTM